MRHEEGVQRRCIVATLAALTLTAPITPGGAAWADRALAAVSDRSDPSDQSDRKLRFPARLTTIDGEALDVVALAAASTLVVVTLKASSCPVCQHQLARLMEHGATLRDCGVRFIVVGPGPREELAAIRRRTAFPHPFVEDSGFELSESLGLRMSTDEIVPAFLLIEPDLTVSWTQLGRSGANFGDAALLEKLACTDKLTI